MSIDGFVDTSINRLAQQGDEDVSALLVDVLVEVDAADDAERELGGRERDGDGRDGAAGVVRRDAFVARAGMDGGIVGEVGRVDAHVFVVHRVRGGGGGGAECASARSSKCTRGRGFKHVEGVRTMANLSKMVDRLEEHSGEIFFLFLK